MEKKMQKAQANLLARAAVIQLCGVQSSVYTRYHAAIGIFTFAFAGIVLEFDEDNPYNELMVDEAIQQLDEMIERAATQAQKTLDVVKAWRG